MANGASFVFEHPGWLGSGFSRRPGVWTLWFGFWGCFQVHCDWAYWALASTTVKGRVWRSLRKRPFSPGCIIPSESMFGSPRTSLPRSSALLVNPAPDSLTQVWKTRCSACRQGWRTELGWWARQESRSSAGNCQADEPTGITQLSWQLSCR